MRQLIVKEGPLVFVKNLIIAELLSGVIFFCLSFLENYEEFYTNAGLPNLLRYDIFLMVGFSLFQIFLIMYLFLHWYFSYFIVTQNEIIKVSGLIRRVKKVYFIKDFENISLSVNQLENKMKHATLELLGRDNRKLKFRNVGKHDDALEYLKSILHHKDKIIEGVKSLLQKDEGENLEFKETLRHDVKKGGPNRDIEKATLKTIAGLMNASGGILLIGVNNEKEIVGLSQDYKSLQRQNKDGFENYLTLLVRNHLKTEAIYNLQVNFETHDGKDVCLINVAPSSTPTFVALDGKEEFFVRVGNSTQPYSMSEAQNYIKQKWG